MNKVAAKRILMVAFHYPPEHSSSGVLRILKFSKYLPEYGWEPLILSVREKYYEVTDPELVGQIPAGVEVHRTRAIDTKKSLSIRGRYLRLCSIPDRFIGWLPFAVVAGLRLIRKHRVQALYSTSPLATTHLIASTLKTFTGLPWVADFRDPWTEPELAANPRAPLFRLEAALERRVLRRADLLVFTTQQLCREILSRSPGLSEDKAVVIPNGYDEDDFMDLPSEKPDRLPIRIAHTGYVDGSYRSPRGLLQALSALIQRGDVGDQEVRVDFLGGGRYVQSPEFRGQVDQLRLARVVNIVEHMNYADCLRWQARSHILLVLQCGLDTRSLIPAKVFEYLRIGRPILAIVPPSATSELLDRVGGAKIANPDDPMAIQDALRSLIQTARADGIRSEVNAVALRGYLRRELTSRLAQQLDRLCMRT